MSSVGLSEPRQKSLKDPELKEKLQELRQTDNYTNLYYLFRTYLFFALVIGGAIWFDQARVAAAWSWAWSVPVFLAAIVLVGAGQHQLSGLSHEAVHHILFRNRLWNDLASDLFTMFPIFSTTHHYRLQHLAHHQFVNDPQRDPDISQLKTSGHWLNFPVAKRDFLLTLLRQLWIPNLIRFIRVRAAYNATGTDQSPYLRKGWKPNKLPIRVGLVFVLLQAGLQSALVWTEQTLWLALAPPVLLLLALAFYLWLPERFYHQSRVHPVIPLRYMTLLRLTFLTGLFWGLAWLTVWTGQWAAVYYLILWLVPLLTSFSFFMILRQIVQHGNADRGWLTNTRTFFVNKLIEFAVFPMGMEYHLPHHTFATVPHYRLRELHEFLLQYPEYREQAVVVHGYFVSPEHPQVHPTVVDVLGPEYAPHEFHGVHIDNTVLEDDEVEDKEAILKEGEEEKRRLAEKAASRS